MPQAILKLPRIRAALRTAPTPEALSELLWSSKAELGPPDGDDVRVECTADRLDLLCEGGLGMYLQGALGEASGLVPFGGEGLAMRIEADASVAPLRPAIGAVIVTPPASHRLDLGLLDEAVRFQELLHATIGRGRQVASLGIYPAHPLRSPIRYSLEPLDEVEFTPLDGPGRVTARAFFDAHPMAASYGAWGRVGDRCLVLRSADGAVLSLPPILNSREAGEAAAGDTALLLESTGTRAARVEDALGLLALPFAARGWSLSPVEIVAAPGATAVPSPAVARRVALTSQELRELAGRDLASTDVRAGFARCRLTAHANGEDWSVEVPPWRPDLQTGCDLAEDLLLIRGVRAEDGVLAPSSTRGARSGAAIFRGVWGARLLGLGFVPLYTPVLVPRRATELVGRAPIWLANPVSDQYAALRDRLLISLIGTLQRNRRSGYPQRFSEIGPVVVRSTRADSGAETRYHAGLLLAGDGAGFADVAAWVDYLLRVDGVAGVREPVERPGTIPGRTAVVRLAGELVAELGELHPALLDELGVPVPAAYAEVDLRALAPLLGRVA